MRGGKVYKVSDYIAHENYGGNFDVLWNDIAVIKLETRLKYGPTVKSIRVADKTPAPGKIGWISGYGNTVPYRAESYHLQELPEEILPFEKCQKLYDDNNLIGDDVLCTIWDDGFKSTCQGDSGGPLIIDNKVVGLVSFGEGCGRQGWPTIYTNVAAYRDWIEQASDDLLYEK